MRRFGTFAREHALAALHDEQLAEDAVQAAFLRMVGLLGQLREPRSFPAWLRQIIRTEAGRILRKRAPAPDGHLEQRIAPACGPVADAMNDELRQVVRQAVAQLPTCHRAVAEHYYLAEQSVADVARDLDLPPGTVKRQLYEARIQLRACLKDFSDIWWDRKEDHV